ncbi:MAG: hypothetical protein IJG60_00300 [Thermoguttaceae bacterium]|nr:hypothetical protein [Thermoguttaceae bacterium]
MPKFLLGSETARRIVEAGSDVLFYDIQRAEPPGHWQPNREIWRCRFTNEGRWPIAAGELAGVTGLADADLDSGEAVEKWRQEGLRLRVKRIGLIDDANAAWLGRGTALDEIPVGGTGRGAVTDLFCALVWRDPEVIDEAHRFLPRAEWKTVNWIDPNDVSRKIRRLAFVKYPGEWTVIDAARPDADNNVFALLAPAPAGPAVTRIESVDLAAGTARLACGVTADSPLADLSAGDVGKETLLLRDSDTRRWHILLKR